MRKELEEAVRRALEEAPCSDRALALEAGVTPSTVSRIRNGLRSPTPEVARALADALGRWSSRTAAAENRLREALAREEAGDE